MQNVFFFYLINKAHRMQVNEYTYISCTRQMYLTDLKLDAKIDVFIEIKIQ